MSRAALVQQWKLIKIYRIFARMQYKFTFMLQKISGFISRIKVTIDYCKSHFCIKILLDTWNIYLKFKDIKITCLSGEREI